MPDDTKQIDIAQGKKSDCVESNTSEIKHQSDALDEALKESFPASDPIAISVKKPKKKYPPKK